MINSLTFDVIHIFFCRSSLICPLFFFFIALLEYTHFILVIIFSCDLGMPPSIWVFWALLPFGFLTALLSFLIIEISLAPSVGCDPSRDLFMKEKLFRLKKGSQGMYLFQNVKWVTKMAFPHFKRKQQWLTNFDFIQYDGLVFAKIHFMNHE